MTSPKIVNLRSTTVALNFVRNTLCIAQRLDIETSSRKRKRTVNKLTTAKKKTIYDVRIANNEGRMVWTLFSSVGWSFFNLSFFFEEFFSSRYVCKGIQVFKFPNTCLSKCHELAQNSIWDFCWEILNFLNKFMNRHWKSPQLLSSEEISSFSHQMLVYRLPVTDKPSCIRLNTMIIVYWLIEKREVSSSWFFAL